MLYMYFVRNKFVVIMNKWNSNVFQLLFLLVDYNVFFKVKINQYVYIDEVCILF